MKPANPPAHFTFELVDASAGTKNQAQEPPKKPAFNPAISAGDISDFSLDGYDTDNELSATDNEGIELIDADARIYQTCLSRCLRVLGFFMESNSLITERNSEQHPLVSEGCAAGFPKLGNPS